MADLTIIPSPVEQAKEACSIWDLPTDEKTLDRIAQKIRRYIKEHPDKAFMSFQERGYLYYFGDLKNYFQKQKNKSLKENEIINEDIQIILSIQNYLETDAPNDITIGQYIKEQYVEDYDFVETLIQNHELFDIVSAMFEQHILSHK